MTKSMMRDMTLAFLTRLLGIVATVMLSNVKMGPLLPPVAVPSLSSPLLVGTYISNGKMVHLVGCPLPLSRTPTLS